MTYLHAPMHPKQDCGILQSDPPRIWTRLPWLPYHLVPTCGQAERGCAKVPSPQVAPVGSLHQQAQSRIIRPQAFDRDPTGHHRASTCDFGRLVTNLAPSIHSSSTKHLHLALTHPWRLVDRLPPHGIHVAKEQPQNIGGSPYRSSRVGVSIEIRARIATASTVGGRRQMKRYEKRFLGHLGGQRWKVSFV